MATNNLSNQRLVVKHKDELYKGLRLVCEVQYFGLGGKLWILNIVTLNGLVLGKFVDEAHCVVREQAQKYIDETTSIIGC